MGRLKERIKGTLGSILIGASATITAGCGPHYLYSMVAPRDCNVCSGLLYVETYTLPVDIPCLNIPAGRRAVGGLNGFHLGMEDSHFLVDNCGFGYYQNREGGIGSTLEMMGCNDSVYLKWMHNYLWEIAVREGWTGQTDRGLRIGDSLERFKELYPKAWTSEPNTDKWSTRHLTVRLNDKSEVMFIAISIFYVEEGDTPLIMGPSEWYWE